MSYNGFEENRLRWCIYKVKGELDKKRQVSIDRQAKEHLEFISSIKSLNENLCVTIQSELSNSRQVLVESRELLNQQNEIANQSKAGITALMGLSKLQLEQNKAFVVDMRSTQEILKGFVEANSSNLTAMQSSSDQMAASARHVGDSANELKLAIREFQSGVSDVISTLEKDLGNTINLMSENFSENMRDMSQNLESATSGISTAVSDLAKSVGATMSSVEFSIKESMDIQKKAQVEFLTTSETLNAKVGSMTGLVDKLSADITSGLSAISASNRSMISLNSRYEGLTKSSESSAEAISALIENLKEKFAKRPSGDEIIKLLKGIDKQLTLLVKKDQRES